MPNTLPRSKQVAIVNALVEGCSIRSIERMTGSYKQAITALLVRVGDGCSVLLDETMRDFRASVWKSTSSGRSSARSSAT